MHNQTKMQRFAPLVLAQRVFNRLVISPLAIALLSFAMTCSAPAQTNPAQTNSRQSGLPQPLATGNRPVDANLRPAVSQTPLPKPSRDAIELKKPQQTRSTNAGSLNTIFALGIVLTLFFGLSVVVKRTWPNAASKRIPTEVLEVIGRLQLQPKQHWMLIRFGSKLLLVCQQPGETQLISEITDENEIQRLIALCEKPLRSDATLSTSPMQSLWMNRRSATG